MTGHDPADDFSEFMTERAADSDASEALIAHQLWVALFVYAELLTAVRRARETAELSKGPVNE